MRMLLIDNYDSFTHNLAHLLIRAGSDVVVRRNDSISEKEILEMKIDALCLSPGPGRPSDSGCSADFMRLFAMSGKPVLGVCLGMQLINEVFGGSTIHAPRPVHGRADEISHTGESILSGLPSPFAAARYHSLCIGKLGADLRITAKSPDNVPMAIEHVRLPVFGVQFHPESFMTPHGLHIARNFLCLCSGTAVQ